MANQPRPKTMREIQAEKKPKVGKVRILNISKQLVKINLKPPNRKVDWYIGTQDVDLRPGKMATLSKDRVQIHQIERLCKQGHIQVIYDSDRVEEKLAALAQPK
jgi:hypothetical protein